jgi:hypothetical protein
MTNRRVRVPDHVLTREVDGQLVVLNLDNEQFYGLDEVGTSVWGSLTQTESVNDTIARLVEVYDVDPQTLATDIDTLLAELETRGLVQVDPVQG